MKHELMQLLFNGILNENIVKTYSDYINNKIEWVDDGSAEPTSRLVDEGYEEWSDGCVLSPIPFTDLNTRIYVYWLFDEEKIKDLETEDYPWSEADYFMFYDEKFNTLERLFEYIIKLYMDGDDL